MPISFMFIHWCGWARNEIVHWNKSVIVKTENMDEIYKRLSKNVEFAHDTWGASDMYIMSTLHVLSLLFFSQCTLSYSFWVNKTESELLLFHTTFTVTGITASNAIFTRWFFFNDLQCLRSACDNFQVVLIWICVFSI